MADCRALAETVASWGGAVVPARVVYQDGGYTKSSIKGWPSRATSDKTQWREDWFTWGGAWWVALCPRVGGLVALDLDGPEAVEVTREAIALMQLPWDDANPPLAYRTPGHGGGLHVVWRWPRELPSFTRMVVTLEGGGQIDLRGESTFLLLCGAPRPDLNYARYELVTRPGEDGPPPAPEQLVPWMQSLGQFARQSAPSLEYKQMSPEAFIELAEAAGGKIAVDRHSTLFAVASYLRVRTGTRTFETLAAELWRLTELYVDFGDEGEESWQTEVLRVARNASKYTQERDEAEAEAARAFTSLWRSSSI